MGSRADLHVHTKYSGLARLGFLRFPESVSEPRDVVKQANRKGLSVVCVTDHNTIRGGVLAKDHAKEFPGTEVVIGEEISTLDGELIGLYLNETVPKDLSAAESVDRIRAQGGITVAPHPFSAHVPGLGSRVDLLNLDALEVLNGGHVDGYANDKAAEHARSGRWATVGGSDSHSLPPIGCSYTEFDGQGAEGLRKSVLNKSTKAGGSPMPIGLHVAWSVEVAFASDRLLIGSLLGRNVEVDEYDVTMKKVRDIGTGKKILAIAGSIVFFVPPIPYLVGIIGQRRIRMMNSGPMHEEDSRKRLI